MDNTGFLRGRFLLWGFQLKFQSLTKVLFFFFQNSRKSRKTPKLKRVGGQSLSSSAEQARFTLTGHVMLHNVDVRTCITTSMSFFGLFSVSFPPCRLIPDVRWKDFLMESKGAVYLLMLYVGAAHRSLPRILTGSKVSIAHFFSPSFWKETGPAGVIISTLWCVFY